VTTERKVYITCLEDKFIFHFNILPIINKTDMLNLIVGKD